MTFNTIFLGIIAGLSTILLAYSLEPMGALVVTNIFLAIIAGALIDRKKS